MDEATELNKLIEKAGDGDCTIDEYVGGDNDLPICADMDNDNSETEFFSELTNEIESESDSDQDDDSADSSVMSFEAPPKLRSYKEAILALEDVSHFLLYKGHVDEAVHVGATTDVVSQLSLLFNNTNYFA